jgi:hypothetical protein
VSARDSALARRMRSDAVDSGAASPSARIGLSRSSNHSAAFMSSSRRSSRRESGMTLCVTSSMAAWLTDTGAVET